MLNNDHESFAAAQARAAAAVSCESVVLPSGLTVLCRTMPGYSSVHAIYATGFGSVHRAFRLDGKQITLPAGTAHFLEHKMCETPKGDSFTFYAKTGASANAFTSYDRTCYLFSATQKIDENLDILLGMVGKPWFTKATIAKEQGIIGQEIKMYDDSPDWRLLNALFRCLYADHPLRDDIAGTVESIAELTPQMLYSCTRGFYAPSNMVLSVAGKITLAQAVDACKRNGLYRARAPHEVEWDIPAQTGPLPHKEAFFTMPVTKPCFGVAYREEPLAEGDLKRELLLDMLGDLVVGGLTKLYRRLYDEALVNPEFSGDFIAVRGACAVAFTGESDTPREVVDLLQAEIERLRTEGIEPEVFTLVKNQVYGGLLGDVEAIDDAAEEAAAAYLKGRTLADEIAALAALTVDDANELLRTALVLPPRARRVLCVWAAVPGLVCAPFAFWQSVWAGAVFCIVWAALVALVRARCCSFVAALTADSITVQAGVAVPVLRRIPRRAVTGVQLLRTPLLWAAGCTVLLVRSPGLQLVLPGIPAAQATALAAVLMEGDV